MKAKALTLTIAVLAMWGLKRYYADSSADGLRWILAPTARMVSITTGTAFIALPGEGYLSPERRFLIEKSCAGLNFMIAAFGMTTFGLHRRVRSSGSGAAVLAASLAASYAAAVIVNAARISVAMSLAAHPLMASVLPAAQIHRLEGIVVYFGGLVALYELVTRVDRGQIAARGRPPSTS